MDNKEILNWPKLDKYTKEFKQWILALFGKAHARMGHIEELVAEVKKQSKYEIDKTVEEDGTIKYSLIDSYTKQEHGESIIIDASGGVSAAIWVDDIPGITE